MTTWQKARRLSWLLPLMCLGSQLGVDGISNAEACSGGAPSVGWNDPRPVDFYEEGRIPVATDGFVLLRSLYVLGDVDPADLGVDIRVTDEDGADVPGTLRLLRARDGGDETVAELGWQADEPLAIGSLLELTWSPRDPNAGEAGAPAVSHGKTLRLEVRGEPTPLPKPIAHIEDWLEIRHGAGELADCNYETSCGITVRQVPPRHTHLLGVSTSWQVPAVTGMVAWETWAEAADPENGEGPVGREHFLIGGPSTPAKAWSETVAFFADATDHCIVVVVKDLRTGEERRSDPLCQPVGKLAGAVADNDLGECSAPPTPEALPYWCETQGDDPRCDGVPVVDDGFGGAASFDEPATVAGEHAGGSPSTSGGQPTRRDEPTSEAGGGCQLASTHASFGSLLVGVCGLAALARRRRAGHTLSRRPAAR